MNISQPLLIKKLVKEAYLPTRGSARAAGYDLYSIEDKVITAQGKSLIKTGLSIAIPSGNYGRIAPRSGLALKNFIDVGAGVIDEDYRGEVQVLLFNHAQQEFEVKVGDRIAQLIIEKITQTEIVEVENLEETERGGGGFGSTGINLKRKMEPMEHQFLEEREEIIKRLRELKDVSSEYVVPAEKITEENLRSLKSELLAFENQKITIEQLREYLKQCQ